VGCFSVLCEVLEERVRSVWGGCGDRVGTGLRTVFLRELRSARTWASWSDSGEEDMAFLSAGVSLE
jgi:hypothetical protein